jgi:hypothetical protein
LATAGGGTISFEEINHHLELHMAIPSDHRLAALERIPRSELRREPFLDWPTGMNRVVVEHIHRNLLGDVPYEHLVEVAEATRRPGSCW